MLFKVWLREELWLNLTTRSRQKNSIHTQQKRYYPQLPTWGLDFRTVPNDALLDANKLHWNAGGIIQRRPTRKSVALEVDAVLFDPVTTKSIEIDISEVDGFIDSLTAARDMVRDSKLTDLPEEPLWRTLVYDRAEYLGESVPSHAFRSSLEEVLDDEKN
ncbi:hypothetical protein BU23DRAFT_243742 [Bimuria novae-zelandiae CBS 107.79]|uniref:Uncharacterized protein n=1 Tax=Bimuria novae-zelandiae CBS 107.79 TaxID=1447943 RepID=A0A6A5UWJ3_9PLEO|nr:hypothetical protein BU23DRAFT_243742 [Bimuria novae-zelandiae CBS 107.79]